MVQGIDRGRGALPVMMRATAFPASIVAGMPVRGIRFSERWARR